MKKVFVFIGIIIQVVACKKSGLPVPTGLSRQAENGKKITVEIVLYDLCKNSNIHLRMVLHKNIEGAQVPVEPLIIAPAKIAWESVKLKYKSFDYNTSELHIGSIFYYHFFPLVDFDRIIIESLGTCNKLNYLLEVRGPDEMNETTESLGQVKVYKGSELIDIQMIDPVSADCVEKTLEFN